MKAANGMNKAFSMDLIKAMMAIGLPRHVLVNESQLAPYQGQLRSLLSNRS